jgi:predicted amidohydrolase YtcJ
MDRSRREFIRTGLAVAGAATLASASPAIARRWLRGGSADLVLTGGPVYTVDRGRSVAQAVAIVGDRIAFVGSVDDVAGLIGPTTEVIQLEGRMVMPGIHDGHIHPLGGGQTLTACSLGYEPLTLDQMRDVIAACLAEEGDLEPDTWLEVGEWDYVAIKPPGTVPSKADLDVLDTARPIIVYALDGHVALANSRALTIAGVSSETPDPPDGEVVRDAAGEPTGLLLDGAIGLVTGSIPDPTLEQNAASLRAGLREMNRQGITSFLDASVGGSTLAAHGFLRDAGELTARSTTALFVSPEELADPAATLDRISSLRERYHGAGLSVSAVKLFFDGVMEHPTQTAALLRPYRVNTGTRAHPHWEPGDDRGPTYFPRDLGVPGVTALDAAGWQVHVHAIGDRAVRSALDCFEAAKATNGTAGRRHTIAHLELVDPSDFGRFRALGVVPVMQMQWAELDSYTVDFVKPYLGARRWRWLYPTGSLTRAGAPIAGGSDWPVDPLLPLRQIEMAANREGDEVYPFYPGPLQARERIGLDRSIAMHTLGSARQLHQDHDTGSIEAGKLADLIVLDRDIRSVPLRKVSRTRVLLTAVGGQVVHRDADL